MKKVVLLAGAIAAGMASTQAVNAASTTASVAEVDAIAALDNAALYNKIVPAVNEDYHLLDIVEKAYKATPVGIKEVIDAEYEGFMPHYTEVLGELTNKVEACNNDEDGFTQEEYDECKTLADQYETELLAIQKRIVELEAANLAHYNDAMAELALVKADIDALVADDVDHPETECPSEAAAENVTAALAAANTAVETSAAAIEALYNEGHLCLEGEFIDLEATNDLRAALNIVDDARNVYNTYVDEVRYAEANDLAFEELFLAIEAASAQWTVALQAVNAVEMPYSEHPECYEELRNKAINYLNGVYQTYIGGAQTWAEDAYNREALLDIEAHETVGEKPEIEAHLASMTAEILAQAKNTLEDEIAELQANDAAYEEFAVAAMGFFNQIFTPTLNLVEGYEIPYAGHDECYEAVRTEAKTALEETYEACNALLQTASYYWHHEENEANADLDSRVEGGEGQHAMVKVLDQLLYMLNEVLTQEISDAYNAFQTATAALEANDAAYEEFVGGDLNGINASWTMAYNATVNNAELLERYDKDGLHRLVDTWEPIVEEYTAKLNEIQGLIEALTADAEASWHEGHSFIADRDAEPEGLLIRLYGEEGIQALIGAYMLDFNAKIEAEKAKLENERAYRYTFENGVADLHKLIKQGQHAINEIEEKGNYYGFEYSYFVTDRVDEAIVGLARIGREVETDNATGAYLYNNMECAHSEGAYTNAFERYQENVIYYLDGVFGGPTGWDYFKDLFIDYMYGRLTSDYRVVFNDVMNGYYAVVDNYDSYDPFVSAIYNEYVDVTNNYLGTCNVLYNKIRRAYDSLFEDHLKYSEEFENLKQAAIEAQVKYTDAFAEAYHLTNGKTLYSDQEYFTLGFFKEANDGNGEQAQEMFNTVEVLNMDDIRLFDATLYAGSWDDNGTPEYLEDDIFSPYFDAKGRHEYVEDPGETCYVAALAVGEKQNELSFNFNQNGRGLERKTLAAGMAQVKFLPGSISVDGWEIKRPVYFDNLEVAVPEEDTVVPEILASSNKLIVRFDSPIDLTYTINSLVAHTDNGGAFSYADRVINEEAGQIEFTLPEGTKAVELPEGFFTFRTGENTIARSAARFINVAGTTAIDSIAAMGENVQIFDLQGRRVKADALVSGNTYVVNGSKMVVK